MMQVQNSGFRLQYRNPGMMKASILSHPNLTGMYSRHGQVVPNGHQGLQFPWGTKCLRQQACQTQCSMKEPRPVVVPHVKLVSTMASTLFCIIVLLASLFG